MKSAPTFEYEIDGRRILVFDGVTSKSEHRAMAEALSTARYVRGRYTSPLTEFARYWTCVQSKGVIVGLPLYRTIVELFAAHFPDKKIRFRESYVNNNGFGDLLAMHSDSPDEGAMTALYYVNEEWDVHWGGETLFFKGSDEAVACVTPKPSRLVLFDGRLQHRANPPLRNCYAGRMGWTFKFDPASKAAASSSPRGRKR